MRIAGGVIALVAGIFAILAAVITLFVGGVGSGLDAEGAGTVIGLGWGGLAAAFLTIVFGAVAIGVRRRAPGVLLILTALVGAVLGGTLVAVFMVLALLGGILATIGGGRQRQDLTQGTGSASGG